MSISGYYKEWKKLLAAQEEERKVLIAHGIPVEDIEKIHQEDCETWKADRVYRIHNTISIDVIGEEELSSKLLQWNGLETFDDMNLGFLDLIENDKLYMALKSLKPDELALVEACLINDVRQEDYAASIGKSQSAVSRRLERIKEKIIKFLK